MIKHNYNFLELAKTKSLMIVEDEPLTADYISKCLSGFRSVTIAKNGLEALKLYNENKYDLVISDIYMPKMDGVELAEKIKEKNYNQPIAIISTSEDARHLIKLIDVGINSFLLKPVTPEEILEKITKVLVNIQHKEEIKKLELEEMLRRLGNKKYQDKALADETRKKVDHLKDINEKEWLNFKRYQDDSMFLIDDFEKLIQKILSDNIDYFVLEDISQILEDLFKIFSLVEDFKGLAKELLRLSEILDNINLESIGKNDRVKKFELLECILEDIRTYIYDVFIDEKVTNTDYFEKSLMYNIDTFETTLNNQKEQTGSVMFL